MQNNLERAKDLLPAIILTILSMIQALALELFWGNIKGSAVLWQGGLDAVVSWLQLLVMLVGMLLIWVFYISFVLRFTWLPSLEDTLIPFLIGLLEFALIDMMRPDLLYIWFPLLGAVFAVATVGSHLMMRRARRDAANDYFFSKVAPASWSDYLGTIIVVIAFCVFGLVLWWSEHDAVMSVAALVIALGILVSRFVMAKQYWMHSLTEVALESPRDNDQ